MAVYSNGRASAQDVIQQLEHEYSSDEESRRLTAVTFRSFKSVKLSTNLIRLGDVVEPVDSNLPGWEQISRLGIGLLPVDGSEMVIDRERLESFISRGQKSPTLIRWIGPASIRVCYGRAAGGLNRQLVPSSASGAKPAGLSVSDILRVSATAPVGAAARLAADAPKSESSIEQLDRELLVKMQRWIRTGLAASCPGGVDLYNFRIVDVEKIRPSQSRLDIAILGKGLVQVLDPSTGSVAHASAGKLDVDINGDLVIANEKLITPLHPAVNIPSDAVQLQIDADGVVKVQRNTVKQWFEVGKVCVVTPDDAGSHEPMHAGEAVMLASATEPLVGQPADGIGRSWQVLQGFRESPDREAYRDFESITRVDSVSCLHDLQEGLGRFRMQGHGLDGPVDLVVSLILESKRLVAAPRKSFPRGHRLMLQDLHLIPIETEQVDNKQFESLQQLVGMEVSKSLRVNRPILSGDVRQPTVVKRGELLDLRVVGAGIVVSTPAKALNDGPLNGLIEVETMRPRKKKIARVVGPGVVEILTRPPQVEKILETRRK